MENYGALVGWTHHDNGERLMLKLESLRTSAAEEPDLFRCIMTKQQAAVLGNYLIEVSGQTRIDPRDRTWFRRLFG